MEVTKKNHRASWIERVWRRSQIINVHNAGRPCEKGPPRASQYFIKLFRPVNGYSESKDVTWKFALDDPVADATFNFRFICQMRLSVNATALRILAGLMDILLLNDLKKTLIAIMQ